MCSDSLNYSFTLPSISSIYRSLFIYHSQYTYLFIQIDTWQFIYPPLSISLSLLRRLNSSPCFVVDTCRLSLSLSWARARAGSVGLSSSLGCLQNTWLQLFPLRIPGNPAEAVVSHQFYPMTLASVTLSSVTLSLVTLSLILVFRMLPSILSSQDT